MPLLLHARHPQEIWDYTMMRTTMAATWTLASIVSTGPAASQLVTENAALRRQITKLQSRLEEVDAQRQDTAAMVQKVRSSPETNPGSIVQPERAGVRLSLAGRVNQAVLFADQGSRVEAFVHDNDASGSRFELRAETEVKDYKTGVEIVVSAEVNSSDEIDFGETLKADDDNALGDFRQAHWFIESEPFGYLSVGQGDTAAEDTAHADLSRTGFAGSGSDVDDIVGGLVFATGDGTELARLDDFFDMQDGSRSLRMLYETPELVDGLSLKGSLENNSESLNAEDDVAGDGLSPAVGLAFQREFDEGFAIAAEASWRRAEQDGGEDAFIVGSVSVLLASGLNLTVAASWGDLDQQDAVSFAVFAKIGYIGNWWDVGETRFSFDYFNGENGPDFASPEGDLPEAKSYGFFAVQEFAALKTEVYAGMRLYELDGAYVDGEEKDVDNLNAVITGAMVRF